MVSCLTNHNSTWKRQTLRAIQPLCEMICIETIQFTGQQWEQMYEDQEERGLGEASISPIQSPLD